LGALLLCRPAAAEPALKVTLQLRQASVQSAAEQMSRELEAPVRIEGTRKAPLALDLTEVSGREALDALAGAANGRWQRIYVFSGQGRGQGAGRLTCGRLVTLNVEKTSVAAAATMVAKAAGARWELENVPEKPVTIAVESEPVEAVLDRLSAETGMAWRAEYVLTVAEPAAVETPAKAVNAPTAGHERSGGGGTPQNGPAGRGVRGPARGQGSVRGGNPIRVGRGVGMTSLQRPALPADQALCQPGFYDYIFILPRTKREPFIKNVAQELKAIANERPHMAESSLDAQARFERNLRLRTIVGMIQALPAAKQRELQPIVDAIPQGMQMGATRQ
jgi:hypothetical protein